MKKSISLLVFLCISFFVFSQDCTVEMQALKGTYAGECKKGKANGKGKALGTDTYEGDFKSGLPDGEGTYTWANGNRYIGHFTNGLKEGKGNFFYKRENAKDSILAGYWLNDKYNGLQETAYKLVYKSRLINDLEVEYKQDPDNRITFFITNTSGGGFFIDGTEMPKMKIDEIQIISGSYGRLVYNDSHAKKTESILEDVVYPIRFKANIGEEQLEMEFKKPGNYLITMRINN